MQGPSRSLPMQFQPTALERAFELARSGDYAGVSEIGKQLKVEGYGLGQLEGDSLRKQLRRLCEAAQRKA